MIVMQKKNETIILRSNAVHIYSKKITDDIYPKRNVKKSIELRYAFLEYKSDICMCRLFRVISKSWVLNVKQQRSSVDENF